MRKALMALVAVAVLTSMQAFAQDRPQDTPWWQQGKINFMWGCWGLSNPGTSIKVHWQRPTPQKVFHNAAMSGATVFADIWKYNPANARFAKEADLKYFACSHLHHMEWVPGGRAAVTKTGELNFRKGVTDPRYALKCPLDEAVWERWLANEQKVEGIRQGLIDGIHTDWEAAQTHVDSCYCDVCFSTFLKRQGLEAELPDKTERYAWLEQRGILDAYLDKATFSGLRVEMFTRIRKKLQAIKPDLMFSSYGTGINSFTRAMHTPQNPYILLDSRHYYNDDRQPWWESYNARLKQEGYLYIAGGWTNALFGSQPSQVSATRWIYEAMINYDGVWLWFEHELTDEMFAAYAGADRAVREVEGIVGDFLFQGRRDPHFVTATEWSGNPDLESAVLHRTYHLNDEHLVHVNNVNAEWPLRVRIRFPRLTENKNWTVRDPKGDVYYTPDGATALWTSARLHAGIVVAMDTRSDVFLLLSRADATVTVDASRLMRSREFDAMSPHADAASQIAAVKPQEDLPKHGWRFRMDKDDVGVGEQWHLPTASLDKWTSIEIEDFWGDNGGTGHGWYRRDVDVPELPRDRRIYLHFAAVDEELKLWIDGQYVGEYNRGPAGWDKPFAIDVTGKLTAGRRHLALRVHNSAAAGGVWKPVSILAGDAIDGDVVGRCVYDEKLEPLLAGAEKIAVPPDAGASGRIVYTATTQMLSGRSSGGRSIVNNAIHTASADGEGGQLLRHLRGYLWSPRYSGDGARIAFVHDAGGRGQIYVIGEDRSGAVNVSSNAFCDRSPVWSPDGEQIAFSSDRTGDWEIYVMNADGSDQRRLAGNTGLDRAPAWSPGGGRIAWLSHVSGVPNIWVCDTDGQDSRPLIGLDDDLTFQRGNVGENQVFQYTDVRMPFPDNTFYFMPPVWSPDGDRIAAVVLGGYSGHSLAVIDADGSRMLQVISWIGGVGDLCWSPDGTQLAASYRTAPQETERSGILVIKADGADEKRHGKWLIDVTPQGPRLGGAIRRGTDTWYSHGSARPRRVLKSFASLAWSPDGKTLAFSSDLAPNGAFYVYTISPDGGEPVLIDRTKSAWPNEVMWRPQRSR